MNISRALLLCLFPLLGLSVTAFSVFAADPKADLKRAEEIVGGRCFLCHGLEGESSSPLFPRLAGQHGEYMARQLADFQSGRRKSETMQAQAGELTAAEMKALGLYFESKRAVPHPPEDRDLAGVGRYIFTKGNPFSGVAACAGCHGAKGLGTPQLPRLAGQHPQYVESQLRQFNRRERTNDNAVMHAVASRLSELEIKAVAEFIGALD